MFISPQRLATIVDATTSPRQLSWVMDKKNPKFAKAIVLKEFFGFSVPEIAKKLDDSERNIYYYLTEAKKIGKQYRKETT